jgi:L-seryl-tRNA(Ser) seleniumtransferase
MSDLRLLPAVDQLLKTDQAAAWINQYGRPLTLEALRQVLAEMREKIKSGQDFPGEETLWELTAQKLKNWLAPTLLPVINATGVILHTNLGRAPLSQASLHAIQAASAYNTLEFNLESGKRGSRLLHAEALLARLTGAEAALVVNNNAAAVLLALSALARRKRVLISRSQLVEIGGGFRVPDVMAQSGARLVEVGTTNRTHLQDFEQALAQPAALLLRVHHSNFKITGFTSEVSLAEMVALGQRFGVPVLDDLGSGTFLDTGLFGLAHEPTIQESVAAGADVITFSGDKLLGGPQAGIIIGRKKFLETIKKHPLARAVRADKLNLAALSATLQHYLKNEAEKTIPIWRMIARSPAELQQQAQAWQAFLKTGQVLPGFSTIGGGSLPGETLPTWLLALKPARPDAFLAALRKLPAPIIARIENDLVVLDPRTVLPEQEQALLSGLLQGLSSARQG